MNTFTLGACFQHELHTRPYFMAFAPRLNVLFKEIRDIEIPITFLNKMF